MSDHYRPPTYHYKPYNPSHHPPPQSDPISANALTTRLNSSDHRQSDVQLSPPSYRPGSNNSSDYLDPNSTRHRHRSRSRHARSPSRHHRSNSHSRSRSRSTSRTAEWGATLAGAAAGALVGHKAGHGSNMGTVGGIIAGAVGAHELERGYEKRRERKRAEEEGGGGRGARRRSSGGLMGEVKEKVEGFLKVGDEGGKRRSRSHGGSEGKGGYGYGYGSEVDGDEWERYERREGGRRRARDDYH